MSAHIMRSGADESRRWVAVSRHFDAPEVPNAVGAEVFLVVNDDAVGAIALPVFVHPQQATYVFGPDFGERDFPIPIEALRVNVPTHEGRALYASQVAAIVLYDRLIKLGGE